MITEDQVEQAWRWYQTELNREKDYSHDRMIMRRDEYYGLQKTLDTQKMKQWEEYNARLPF